MGFFVCLVGFGETLDFDEPYLYQCYIFILFFKFMKFDCCPLWKLKRKKTDQMDFAELADISTESTYCPVW